MVIVTVNGVHLGSETPTVVCHTSTGIVGGFIPFVSIGVIACSFLFQKKLFRLLSRDSTN